MFDAVLLTERFGHSGLIALRAHSPDHPHTVFGEDFHFETAS